MWAYLILITFVVLFPRIAGDPASDLATKIRIGSGALIIAGAVFFLFIKLSGSLDRDSISSMMALMQAYFAICFVHVVTSTAWVFSSENPKPWYHILPWKGSKSQTLFGNAVIAGFTATYILVPVVISTILVLGYRFYQKRKLVGET